MELFLLNRSRARAVRNEALSGRPNRAILFASPSGLSDGELGGQHESQPESKATQRNKGKSANKSYGQPSSLRAGEKMRGGMSYRGPPRRFTTQVMPHTEREQTGARRHRRRAMRGRGMLDFLGPLNWLGI